MFGGRRAWRALRSRTGEAGSAPPGLTLEASLWATREGCTFRLSFSEATARTKIDVSAGEYLVNIV